VKEILLSDSNFDLFGLLDLLYLSNFDENGNDFGDELVSELKKLSSHITYETPIDQRALSSLRSNLLIRFGTPKASFLSRKMLMLLYCVYTFAKDDYPLLNKLLFGYRYTPLFDNSKKDQEAQQQAQENQQNQQDKFNKMMLLGIRVYYTNSEVQKEQNETIFPLELSGIQVSKTSTYKDVFYRFLNQYKSNINVVEYQTLTKEQIQEKNQQNIDNLLKNAFNVEDTNNTNINININNLQSIEFIFLKREHTELMFNEFNSILQPSKSEEKQEDEGEEVDNIYTFNEYTTKNNYKQDLLEMNGFKSEKQAIQEINENQYQNAVFTYIPATNIKITNIHTLINKHSDNEDFKFLLNPVAKRKEYNYKDTAKNITKLRAKIISKEFSSLYENDAIVTKYEYTCPKCEKTEYILPNMLSTTIYHECDPTNKIRTKINDRAIKPINKRIMTLYRCILQTNTDDNEPTWSDEIYIHSFDPDIKPGYYIIDTVKFYDKLAVLEGKNYNLIMMMFGHKRIQKYDPNQEIINKNTNPYQDINKIKQEIPEIIEFYNQQKEIPQSKLFNILFSIRKYYEKNYDIKMNNKGMLLQLFIVISAIAKQQFKHNKLAISIMGVGSVSKSFSAIAISQMLDDATEYVSDSKRMTTAAFTGGTNISKDINGTKVNKFEKGKISNTGFTIFDECQSIYTNQEFNSVMKSIPQDEYEIATINGEKVPFTTTPIFLANFNNFTKEYTQKIIEAYKIKYKKENPTIYERTLKTDTDIYQYINKINLHENLEYYIEIIKDKTLANTIYAVRKNFEQNRIDWKTGTQIEAQNRILFDVVIHRKSNKITLDTKIEDTNTKEIKMYNNLPVEQIQKEINEYIYGTINPQNRINIKDQDKNTKQTKEQIERLRKSTLKFLNQHKLGQRIKNHFVQNVDDFDIKIRNQVINTIIILQLIEDINSNEISENTKKLSNIILLKCKRGISEKEYNMEHNLQEIKVYPEMNAEFLVDLEDMKSEVIIAEQMERIQKEKEKQQKEYNGDESLEEYSQILEDNEEFEKRNKENIDKLNQQNKRARPGEEKLADTEEGLRKQLENKLE
jgi:hypothetical protein